VIEMIPFCSKLLRKEDVKITSGEDGACLPSNPAHPTYDIETLRCLFISYLYLFKWVRWDPYFIAHGTLVSRVLGSVVELHDELPMVMEVGPLCSDVMAFHPNLTGYRVHNQVHESFIDRSLSSVYLLFFIIIF
jgi:hypothetical protein